MWFSTAEMAQGSTSPIVAPTRERKLYGIATWESALWQRRSKGDGLLAAKTVNRGAWVRGSDRLN